LSFDGSKTTNSTKLNLYIDGLDITNKLNFTGTLPSTMPTRSDYYVSLSTNYSVKGSFDEFNFYNDAKKFKFAKLRYNNFINPSSIIYSQVLEQQSTGSANGKWSAYKNLGIDLKLF
jgi:hypothetical protein